MTAQGWYQRAYEGVPPWLRDVAVSAYGAYLHRQRYGGEFDHLVEQANAATFATSRELQAIQQRLWREVLAPALREVPAYAGRDVSLEGLKALPILAKAEVRENPDQYVRRTADRRGWVKAHTSGTTGAGLIFWTTRYALRRQWAFWWRYRGWHGITRSEWCGVFGGRTVVPSTRVEPPFWHVNLPGRSILFSQYHLTPERARLYLEEIRRRRIRWLHGYPSILALVARAGLDAGMAGTLEVKWITTGAENLLAAQRRDIERMFGVPPRQHYGMAEGVANISECPDGRLHVDEDYSVVEFLPRADAGPGLRIVGTTLDNNATPLLRYDTGDFAVLAPAGESCPCGRTGRLVLSIDGRREDYIVLADGSLIGRIDHLFKDAVRVTEAQVVQKKAGEAIFRIVRGAGYSSDDEQALTEEVRQRFGDRLRLEFEYVDALPRTSAGKLRLVVSELAGGQIGA